MEGGSTAAGRKVMVVADPTRESAGALQYALAHAIVDEDVLILFHVENSSAWRNINPFGGLFRRPGNIAASGYQAEGGGDVEFLDSMKEACAIGKPKVKVVVVKAEMAEGKDKAAVILAKSAAYQIDLLIIGHKRGFSNSIMGVTRGGPLRDIAEYLIVKSKCTCGSAEKGSKWRISYQLQETQKLLALGIASLHHPLIPFYYK